MSNITLTQARSSLLSFKKDLSDVSQSDFILLSNFADRHIYNFILGIEPERFISTQTYTISSAPQTSALPTGFQTIDTSNCGFYRIDSDGYDTTDNLTRTSHGSRCPGYYITGSNVVFTGIDDSTQYKLRYIPKRTTFTAMSDTFCIDEIYLECLTNDLDRLYSQWDEDASLESLADFRFVRTFEELGNNINDVNSYSLPDFTSNF